MPLGAEEGGVHSPKTSWIHVCLFNKRIDEHQEVQFSASPSAKVGKEMDECLGPMGAT